MLVGSPSRKVSHLPFTTLLINCTQLFLNTKLLIKLQEHEHMNKLVAFAALFTIFRCQVSLERPGVTTCTYCRLDIIIIIIIIIIITLFESQIILAEHECCTNWGDCKSNKSNQIKCWFLWRGENRSSRRKTSRSRVESQQTIGM